MKSDKMPYIIYADIESLIRIIEGRANNPEKSSTTKAGDHIPSGYSISTILGCDHIGNQRTLYRGKNTSLREHANSIIAFEKKEILPLTKE